jgi:Mat/Ecp fimbriae major subunit
MERYPFGISETDLLRGHTKMKIQMLKAALVSTAIAALGFTATTAEAATATATAKAKILRQVTVTKTADLDYGIIVSGPASTVAVSTAGARTCGVGLVCSGTTTAAAFTIGGTTGSVVTISVPATVTLTAGANTMTSTLVSSAATATMVANAGAFTVGGILTVGLNQADGDYTGSFNATVDYQ